jgi:hypothetical protein
MLGCDGQTVRNAIHAFTPDGIASLTPGSHVPHTVHAAFDAATAERLRDVLHHTPRTFGHPTSVWTLELAAAEAHRQGLPPTRVSGETIRATLARLVVRWERAKQWITSPDPAYARKSWRDRLLRLAARHPDWVLGFEDEVWWSRVRQPHLHAWAEDGQPVRMVEQTVAKKTRREDAVLAVACYGLLAHGHQEGVAGAPAAQEAMWLPFVDGRPISAVTIHFLGWCLKQVAAVGKTALVLIGDHSSRHVSRAVCTWVRAYHRHVKATGPGVRLVVCPLPTKSRWLNSIKPTWVHGKRVVAEPAALLTIADLIARICASFGCDHYLHLTMHEEVV